MQPDGELAPMDIRTLPFVRFEDNESHCEGLYDFNLGEGVNRVGPDMRHPFIVRRMKLWGTHYAFRPEVPSLLVEDMSIWRAEYGVYHPNYDNHVYRDLLYRQNEHRAVQPRARRRQRPVRPVDRGRPDVRGHPLRRRDAAHSDQRR